jgi:predicted PurR-regulated permease PerM
MQMFRRNKDAEVSLTVSTANFFRLAVLTVLTVLFLQAVQKASHALLLIFTAFFLALALNAPVYWISRHLPGKPRDNRSLATILSFLIVIVLLGGFIASIAPPLVRQTESFVSAAPKLIKDFRSQDSETGKLIRRYHLEKQVSDVSNQLSGRLKHIGGTAFTTVGKVGSSVFAVLTVLVLTFMMLVEGPRWLGFFKEVLPDRYHERAERLALDMYKVVKGYVNGQVTLAAIAASLLLPALLILHVSYPIALMVIVFICGLIPMIGHTIGAIIVTTVALFHSPSSALFILIYYILYQQVENYLIQPRIQANSTNMSPLLVFMSVVIGVSFSGLFGGLVAIPIAGCIRIVILDYLRMKNIITQPELKKATTETR